MAAGKSTNGVNLEPIGQFVEAVKSDPDVAHITFKASSVWRGGTQTSVTISEFLSNGGVASPTGRKFDLTVDEPNVLGGGDSAPNPVEYLAAGLCGCITAGIATNAEMFGIPLEKLDVDVDLDFDVIGLLAVDRSVPTGSTGIKYTVRLKGKEGVTREQLERCKTVIDGKSPVRNTLAGAIPMRTEVIIE
jgi:uncharacterized OsmC-like protein